MQLYQRVHYKPNALSLVVFVAAANAHCCQLRSSEKGDMKSSKQKGPYEQL